MKQTEKPAKPSQVSADGKYPQEVYLKKWSWGAFLMVPFWALGSKMYVAGILLLVFGYIVPVVNFGVGIYFGVKGREKAWAATKWESFEEFRKRQNLLDNLGFVLMLLLVVLYIGAAMLGIR